MLKKIEITNFRNLADLKLNFESQTTAFVGKNGQGKTNILESIAFLSLGKSLRSHDEKAIRYGEDFFRIVGESETTLEAAVVRQPTLTKRLKLAGRAVIASEFVGQLPVVIFTPEDLNLILLSPALRRRYLDRLLCQTSGHFLSALVNYRHALRQRNALLMRISEGVAKNNELDFWDEKLAEFGSIIGLARNEFVEFATPILKEKFSSIATDERNLKVSLSNFNAVDKEKFLENLTKMRDKDIRYGSTNYGPHRADLVFSLADESLADSGSRGEIRSSILALKFAELAWLAEKKEIKPLFLLDDVFSELDDARQRSLMELIADHQTFITTTKHRHLDAIAEGCEVWEVEGGKVELSKN